MKVCFTKLFFENTISWCHTKTWGYLPLWVLFPCCHSISWTEQLSNSCCNLQNWPDRQRGEVCEQTRKMYILLYSIMQAFHIPLWWSKCAIYLVTYLLYTTVWQAFMYSTSLHPGLSTSWWLLACRGWPAFTGLRTTLSPITTFRSNRNTQNILYCIQMSF